MAQYTSESKQNPDFSQSHLKEKVDLFISCKDLVKKDFDSESDPFCVVYIRKNNHFEEIGRTETVKDNEYPEFATQFKMDYYFEEEQILRFDVFDEDKKGSKKLKDHDFIGSATMILGEIIHEKGQIMMKKLLNKKKKTKKKKKKKKNKKNFKKKKKKKKNKKNFKKKKKKKKIKKILKKKKKKKKKKK
eukprot:44805_1